MVMIFALYRNSQMPVSKGTSQEFCRVARRTGRKRVSRRTFKLDGDTMTSNPSSMDLKNSILLRDYMLKIKGTDKLPQNDLQPVLMGLFGEVGSIMATVKKNCREKTAYAGYQQAVREEFGDTLWYFTILCRRLGIGIDTILSEVANQKGYSKLIAASDLLDGPVSHISSVNSLCTLNKTLLNLGEATAAMLGIKGLDEQTHDLLRTFSDCYLQALQAAEVRFSEIVHMNIKKTRERFSRS